MAKANGGIVLTEWDKERASVNAGDSAKSTIRTRPKKVNACLFTASAVYVCSRPKEHAGTHFDYDQSKWFGFTNDMVLMVFDGNVGINDRQKRDKT